MIFLHPVHSYSLTPLWTLSPSLESLSTFPCIFLPHSLTLCFSLPHSIAGCTTILCDLHTHSLSLAHSCNNAQELLQNPAMAEWALPVIHGSFIQHRFSVFGRCISLSLLCRRSRYFAGTRYRSEQSQEGVAIEKSILSLTHTHSYVYMLSFFICRKRGVNFKGYVANEVEMEQIVEDDIPSGGAAGCPISSFTQVCVCAHKNGGKNRDF